MAPAAPIDSVSAAPSTQPSRELADLSVEDPATAQEQTNSALPANSQTTAVDAAASVLDSPGSGFRSGYQDPRLYLDIRALRPPTERHIHERIVEDAHAAFRALPDSIAEEERRALAERQITFLGRGITVFGDSAASRQNGLVAAVRGKLIMPNDGRAWELREMTLQRESAARDSILQERLRTTRERNDAARRGF